LQFSQAVRYTLNIVPERRSDCYASDITVNDLSLEDQLDKTFLIAYSSFIRHACATWEKQTATRLHRVLASLGSESIPRFDTGLLVAQELIAYVREQGSVTPATGATRDGRLQVTFES
jgi:hypothetical protein